MGFPVNCIGLHGSGIYYTQHKFSSLLQTWNTSGTPAYESWSDAHAANYANVLTEGTGTSSCLFTAEAAAGSVSGAADDYVFIFRQQSSLGTSAPLSDPIIDVVVLSSDGNGNVRTPATPPAGLSALATLSGQTAMNTSISFLLDGLISHAGTIAAHTANTVTLDSGSSATDQAYQWQILSIGDVAYIVTNYVGTTKVATLHRNLVAAPSDGVTAFSLNNMMSPKVVANSGAVQIDLGQDVPMTGHTPGSVGDSLNKSAAQGGGKWVKNGTVLTLYGHDNTTPVIVFDLDNANTPTSRTPR